VIAAEETEASLAEQAYRTLEEMIVTLALPPGALLSENMLSARTGFGRTPIREALQRLAAEHLVLIMRRRGVVVSEVDVGQQLLLVELRREIERLIAASAARRATAEEREQFAAMAREMEAAAAADDDVTFLRLDRAFNELTAASARNPFAAKAVAPLHALSRRFWFIHYKQAADLPLAARVHAAVMDAIAAGDEAAAADASDELLDYIESFTRSTLDFRPPRRRRPRKDAAR
jgi:DNA-binding GntR family transcriptional regulator